MSHLSPNAKAPAESGDWPDEIIQTAADWRARVDGGGMTAEENQRFAAWLEADERHAQIFAEMEETWALLDRTAEIPLPATGDASDVVAAMAKPAGRRRWPAWVKGSLAAAAALVVFGLMGGRVASSRIQYAVVARADAGLVKRVDLPDGSVVRLNSASSVAVEFSGRERRITLDQGEANFSVAKDRSRPFVVTTAGIQVRALGTVFNVAKRSGAVEVLVTEGKVRVDDAVQGGTLLAPSSTPAAAPATPALAAGEKVVIAVAPLAAPAAAARVAVGAEEIAQTLAWQNRRLEFNATPFAEIVAEFNRFNHHQLVVPDSSLASLRFGGSFRADDPETFVRLIATRPGVVVERKLHETIIRFTQ